MGHTEQRLDIDSCCATKYTLGYFLLEALLDRKLSPSILCCVYGPDAFCVLYNSNSEVPPTVAACYGTLQGSDLLL